MKNKLCSIIETYINEEVDYDVNLYGVLYPVDIVYLLIEIQEQMEIKIDLEFILKTKELSVNNLMKIITK